MWRGKAARIQYEARAIDNETGQHAPLHSTPDGKARSPQSRRGVHDHEVGS